MPTRCSTAGPRPRRALVPPSCRSSIRTARSSWRRPSRNVHPNAGRARAEPNRESPMTVKLLDHVNIHTADLAGTVDFYVDVIGLEQGERPTTIGRPGAWLYCGGRPLIHLIEVEQSRHSDTGAIDHVAF